MESPAPKSPEQSDKSKKYDRQLRLWGDHGQAALESAHICVINANALGAEILKSLVLPGIGAFTIVDWKKVTEEDIGSNFFLDSDSLGKPRALTTTQLLLELNPDVKGDCVTEDVDDLLKKNPQFFSTFTVVVACDVQERLLVNLSRILWECGVPLVSARSLGLLGLVRLQYREHCVVESHPDSQSPDLRLDRPFPALRQYVDSVDLDKVDLKDHVHIPFIVPLLKALDQWRAENGGRLPSKHAEKESLRQMIRKSIRLNEIGVPIPEENFEEAIRAVNYATLPTHVSQDVQNILNDDACLNLNCKSEPFWIMLKAVKEFVDGEGEGTLPVRGTLPDMTADTKSYIALQQLYVGESTRQWESVHRRVRQLLHDIGQPDDAISEQDSRLLCRNAGSLAVLRGSCIADEYLPKPAPNIGQGLNNPDSLMVHYVMFRAVNRFFDEHFRYPGEYGDESDIAKLKSVVFKLLNEWGCNNIIKEDYIHEMCRVGGCEFHSVSAFVGGCASQEIIKLVTRQYKPINNTFIYDGITTNTETFCF